MSADRVGRTGTSFLNRLQSRLTGTWLAVVVGLLLLLVPLGAAWIDGALDTLIRDGHLRPVLLPSTIIVYILAVSPILDRMQKDVVRAFRPLVPIDDDEYVRLVDDASRPHPVAETVTFSGGAALGIWIGLSSFRGEGFSLLALCLVPLTGIMLGLIVWHIYGAIAGTRLTAVLQRQQLRIDIFDIKPFEPIGRVSLAISLVILGGVLLAMLMGLARDTLYDWRNWLMYAVLALASVLLFFLNMRDTHRMLVTKKDEELDLVQGHIQNDCRALMARLGEGESAGELAAEINALVAYEKRVQAARTWPYNTTMLRTLFVSVIIPVVGAVARVVGEWMGA